MKQHATAAEPLQRSSSFSSYDLPIQHAGIKLVESNTRQRAQSASNCLTGQPLSEIMTDKGGVVLSVTPDFCEFTGYSEEEMVGRKCNFLQGEGTDESDVLELRAAMSTQRKTTVVILNYCKDGSPFWNVLTIIPEFNKQTQELACYTGEVITLRIPERMRFRPRLCVDDALALIAVFSRVPRALEWGTSDDNDEMAIDRSLLDESRALTKALGIQAAVQRGVNDPEVLAGAGEAAMQPPPPETHYKHQNYATKFAAASGAAADAGGRAAGRGDATGYVFVAETSLPTQQGRYRLRAYRNAETGAEPLAMIVGNVEGRSDVIVRVHDQCLTSEVFGSLKCDCKEQLDYAMEYIQANEGIVLYLPQEGRGIGIANKVAAYAAQEAGLDTVDANRHLGLPDDAREYTSVRDILADLGVKSIHLLSNNPRKFACLQELGVTVSDRLPCVIVPNSEYSMKYVHSKAQRMGHMINVKALSSTFSRAQEIARPSTADL